MFYVASFLVVTLSVFGSSGFGQSAFTNNQIVVYSISFSPASSGSSPTYTLNEYSDTFLSYSGATPNPIGHLNFDPPNSNIPLGSPLPISISDDDHYLSIIVGATNGSDANHYDVIVLNTWTNSVQFTIHGGTIGSGPGGLCKPTGSHIINKKLYVINSATCGNGGPAGLQIFDVTSGTFLNHIDLGPSPLAIAAAHQYVYITSLGADSSHTGAVKVIDPLTDTQIGNDIPVGINPSGLTVSTFWNNSVSTEVAYVVNWGKPSSDPTRTSGATIQAISVDATTSPVTTNSSTPFALPTPTNPTCNPLGVPGTSTVLPMASSPTGATVYVTDPCSNFYALHNDSNAPGNISLYPSALYFYGGSVAATANNWTVYAASPIQGVYALNGLTSSSTGLESSGNFLAQSPVSLTNGPNTNVIGLSLAVTQSPTCSFPGFNQKGYSVNGTVLCNGAYLSTSGELSCNWGNGTNQDLPVSSPALIASFSMSQDYKSSSPPPPPGTIEPISMTSKDANGLSTSIFTSVQLGDPYVSIQNKIDTYIDSDTQRAPAFSARVNYASNQNVTWSLSSGVGTIDPSTGSYSINQALPNPALSPAPTATVVAKWNQDSTVLPDTDTFTIAGPYIDTLNLPPLSFGNQVIGTTSVSNIAVHNIGNALLHLEGQPTSSSNDFAVVAPATKPCNTAVAPGDFCNIGIQFQPTTLTPSNKNATLSIASDHVGSLSALTVGLSGTATGSPAASLSANSLAFNNVVVGTTPSPSQSITLANKGTASLVVTSIGTSPPFSVSNLCGSLPLTIAAGDPPCNITIRYTPVAVTPPASPISNGVLTISDNDPSKTQTVNLSGTATFPVVGVTPNPITFGNTSQGTTSSPSTVTITNNGTALLHLSSIGPSVGTEFSLPSNGCTAPLAPAAQCTIQVSFRPSGTGTRSDSLIIVDDAPDSPQTVSLSGQGGNELTPAISSNVSSLTFGSQAPNTTSPAQTITINNVGTASLTLGAITASGPFKVTPSCPANLPPAPSQGCNVSVVFAPTTTSPAMTSGSLSIVSNDPSHNPLVLTLSGTVAPVAVSISPTSTVVLTGGTKTFVATVQNGNSSAVTWAISGSGCAGHTCGQISSAGIYTAPALLPTSANQSDTVTATSVDDTTKSASAQVTVSLANPVNVVVSTLSPNVGLGSTVQFTAQVQNVSDQVVTWSVNGIAGGNSTVGTIANTGFYTAPLVLPTPATVVIAATADADSSKSSSVQETILPPVAVSISPSTLDLPVGQSQQFTAVVLNAANTSVTWTVKGTGCGGSPCGQISSTGLYTPLSNLASSGTDTVVATSVADGTRFASVQVLVYLPPSVATSTPSVTVSDGQTATFNLTLKGGTGDPNQLLTIQCDTRYLPTGTTCTTTTVKPGSSGATFTVSITTTAPPSQTSSLIGATGRIGLAVLFPFGGIFIMAGKRKRLPIRLLSFLSFTLVAMSLLFVGCGTNGSFTPTGAKSFISTPTGTFTIQINGSLPGGSQQAISNVTLIVQ